MFTGFFGSAGLGRLLPKKSDHKIFSVKFEIRLTLDRIIEEVLYFTYSDG